ncbi:adenosine deaminase [Legionella nautarum]|uniref:adenosine deaminase n=1 Tax=Legionella nautarum TaxID=45070 RepID=A0A0W0X2V0_9GAMM|nr:hypothetical protein [Legionella nautarum]KTD38893.1 adenosine deaminase [Legionella nautarum]
MKLFRISSFLTLLLIHSFAGATVSNHFDTIKNQPNALYSFLKNMPKGGELHYHLAGGAYPETMLALAAQGNYCLDKETMTMTKMVERCQGVTGKELSNYPELYAQTIRAWSLKDFIEGQESNHDHFFASFSKFMPLVADYRPQLLAEIMQRAASQHELYLEIMILSDNAKSTHFAPPTVNPEQFNQLQQQLLGNADFVKNIEYTGNEASRILKQARQDLGCNSHPQKDVCQITVKFQYYILREQNLEKVFAQALNGFAAAERSKDIVAVNLVQAEDGIISLRDYRQQMQIFNFLHQAYPKVHIALHAGELAPTAVVPENLRFHIHDAISVGQAERIGHGVDIAFENDAEKLLQTMAEKGTAVEINLISNKKLLHISGSQHPLNDYLNHKVPVVLSTDDEGLLRTDLTQQYVEAVLKHGLDYPQLKMISRNAITYSFLPGQSLWANANQGLAIESCKELDSQDCLLFAKKNEKARLQRILEKEFRAFENNYASSAQTQETPLRQATH